MNEMVEENEVLAAIRERRSIRGFLGTAVPAETIARLLSAASRAPSGSNTQPWRVHVLAGAAKTRLTAAIMAERASPAPPPEAGYDYYPADWTEPYLGRRRQNGWALYDLLGLAKGERERTRAWHDRNFDFFGAPVGLIFVGDKSLAQGALIDMGMFAQNVMIGAQALGLATCPQAAFAHYHATIGRVLSLSTQDLVLFGMALGYEDPDAVQNSLRTPRIGVDGFTTFHFD